MGKRGVKLEPISMPAQFKSLEQALSKSKDSLDLAGDVSGSRPVTPRRSKNKLRELTDNLFYLLDNIPIGIALISQKTLYVIYANRACLDILSCTSMEEALNLSWNECLLPDSYKQFLELMTKPKASRYYPEHFYLQFKHKGGGTRSIKVYLSDVLKGDRECSLLFFEYITEVVRIEKAHQEDDEKRNLGRLLESFSYRIIEVQEDERRRISYELHDEIGQALTAIQLMLTRALKASPKHITPEHAKSENIIKDLIAQVRRLSLDLNPLKLEIRGLVPSLVEYFRRYKTWSGLSVKFEHSGLDRKKFTSVINNSVYRIIQESLTNVARYAGVKSANVTIRANRQTLRVSIADKGKGFNPKTLVVGRSGGISGMYERVLLLGGKLDIDSIPGKGTRLTAVIPLTTD